MTSERSAKVEHTNLTFMEFNVEMLRKTYIIRNVAYVVK